MEKSKIINYISDALIEVKYLLYALFMFLEIDLDIFKVLIYFMAIDTVFGSLKVLVRSHKKFSFKILILGLISKLGLLIIPLVVALLIKGIGGDFNLGVVLIIKILIVSEFLSSIGNIYTIKTGKEVKDIDIFTMLFKFLRCISIKILSKYLNTSIDIKDYDECNNYTNDNSEEE